MMTFRIKLTIALTLWLTTCAAAQTVLDSVRDTHIVIEPSIRTLDLEADTYFPFTLTSQAAILLDIDALRGLTPYNDGLGIRIKHGKLSHYSQGGLSSSWSRTSETSLLLRYSRLSNTTRGDVFLGWLSRATGGSYFESTSGLLFGGEIRFLIIEPIACFILRIDALYSRNPYTHEWNTSMPGVACGFALGYIQ